MRARRPQPSLRGVGQVAAVGVVARRQYGPHVQLRDQERADTTRHTEVSRESLPTKAGAVLAAPPSSR